MALKQLLKTKPPTSYFKPAPIHLCILIKREQPRVVTWDFGPTGASPASTKKNVGVVFSDGQSVAKTTIYEEFSSKFVEGGSYFLRGYGLRGQSVPYTINITRDTMFFRSGPLNISPELRRMAKSLICPPSPLTPLSGCRDMTGLFTLEGELVEISMVKKISKSREAYPLRQIKLREGETLISISLWREAAVSDVLQVGTNIRVSHLRTTQSQYGTQVQSTNASTLEEVISEEVAGVCGVVDVEGSPDDLNLLLVTDRTALISRALWAPLDAHLINPPLMVKIKIIGQKVCKIELIKD
ncbi:uncharacterized protein ACO6RY_18209 [Pungitius sinensis]